MKRIILGTAGHIDHGKTSLIRALTGIETDRLKEEKERGITIELGFAYLELPGGKLLGIVDVPGHEKFVKNMVAGATGIDLVALVIAADEGVMPQTREHLEICQLLGIQHGLVVLTKIDMVEPDWLELVKEDVREYLSETFLADVSMVEVSSVTGQGLDQLTRVLNDLAEAMDEREAGHLFRLPVDRVFTMKGFGTVITGTTVSGRIATGEEITVYPKMITSKVRGIHVHNQEVPEVQAGLRTAINIQGVEKMMIERGDVLASKDSLRATYMVDGVLHLLKSSPRKLKNRAKVRFHTGTSEIMATTILYEKNELNPGDQAFAQFRLDAPTAVLKGDRYVIRSYSPVRTIGGGQILNPLPKKKKRLSKTILSHLEKLHSGGDLDAAEVFVSMAQFHGLEESELAFLTNLSRKRLAGPLQTLKAQKRIIQYDKDRASMIHADFLNEARKEVLETIDRYHKKFPLKPGLPKEELRSRTVGARNPRLFQFLVTHLAAEKAIDVDKETVRLGGHQVTLGKEQEEARQMLEQVYARGGLQPPYFKEIKGKLPGNVAADVLHVLVQEGVLLKVKEDLYFYRKAIEELQERLVAHLKEHGEITTPQFKDMTGASRKYTIPLLEYFDGSQVTVRVGDSRVLRKK